MQLETGVVAYPEVSTVGALPGNVVVTVVATVIVAVGVRVSGHK